MGAKNVLLGKMLGSAARQSGKQIAETVELLLRHAVKSNASDIHIEPHASWALVRYRIDGDLSGVYKLPLNSLPALLAEFKTRAGLSASSILPQHAAYHAAIDGEEFGIEATTMPVLGGEKLVLHLGCKQRQVLALDALGFWGESLESLRLILARPRGLLLVAGPKRAGKSTVLRSILAMLNRPTVSIAAIESATEYQMPGIAHVAVGNDRKAFATHLEVALQQDTNVLMLEQLPDAATAKVAARAASSGHFVLAGLHADGAAHAILRLESMDIDTFVLGHCLQGVVGLRLVRRLCPNCRERYPLSRNEEVSLARAFGIKNAAAAKRVHELERQAITAKLDPDIRPNTTPSRITHLWRASSGGCSQCNHTGFSGRVALVEVAKNGPHLKKTLADGQSTPTSLHIAALKDGFVPLTLDGLIKSLRGQTTVEQVLHEAGSPI